MRTNSLFLVQCEDWYHTTKCLAKGIQSRDPDNPPLQPDTFDTFVCEACILGPASKAIARYAGTPGFLVLSANGKLTTDLGIGNAKLVNNSQSTDESRLRAEVAISSAQRSPTNPLKRPLYNANEINEQNDTVQDGLPQSKSLKLEHLAEKQEEQALVCSAPPLVNEALLNATLPRKDIYLEDNWRDRLCRCEEVSPSLA